MGPALPFPESGGGLFGLVLAKFSDHMSSENANQNQLNIEITEEIAEGQYANLAIITHSHAEFVIDFVSVMPGTPKSKVKSRLIMTPQHAKRFMKALMENVSRFEDSHGDIQDLEAVEIPMNFGGPSAQA
jgi:ribonuclease BN (tRNA processing enzyme)